ncbi:MAG: hypothetical protein ACE5JH_04005 [Acidobacteriota bacterium]
MAFRRVVAALFPLLALVLLAGCSKTEDVASSPDIFGATPVIENATLSATTTTVQCDLTDEWNFTLPLVLSCPTEFEKECFAPTCTLPSGRQFIKICSPPVSVCDPQYLIDCFSPTDCEGQQQICKVPLEASVTPGPLLIGGTYDEWLFNVQVSDEDSTPDTSDDILSVTATFRKPPQLTDEISLVLLDDGSATQFSFTQKGTGLLSCGQSPTTGDLVCQQLTDFILTTNDAVANDGNFTRAIAVTNLVLSGFGTPTLTDCIALTNHQVEISGPAGAQFNFRIDVVDRAGNIATWDQQLTATPNPTVFTCSGDDCLCCLMGTGVTEQCKGKEGLPGPAFPNGGLCKHL